MQRIEKIPEFCADPVNDLNVGDILIFHINYQRENAARQSSAQTVAKLQNGLNENGGHDDAIHAGFIVEINGEKKLAHLRAKGFVLEGLDKFSSTTHVYRPRKFTNELGAELNKLVADGIKDQSLQKKLTWRFLITIRSYIRRMATSLGIKNTKPGKQFVKLPSELPDNTIARNSICSKYVVDSYISACHRMTKKARDKDDSRDFAADMMNINSFTTPKTLQAYLHRNPNYIDIVIPQAREQLFDNLLEVLDGEIKRLNDKKDELSKDKAALIGNIIDKFKKDACGNSFVKSMALIKALTPTLRINTGNNVRTPTAYTNVMNFAKKQGIYPEYLENDLVYEYGDKGKFTNLVMKTYGLSEPLAKQYKKFIKRGKSDAEALFESNANPTLGEWLALNPSRNALAGALVLPFLLFSIPYGLARVAEVTKRNRKLISAAASTVLFDSYSGQIHGGSDISADSSSDDKEELIPLKDKRAGKK